MPRHLSLKSFSAGLAFAAVIPTVTAHSWVEQVRRIASNGTFTGEPGFPRGMVDRSDPTFNDNLFVHLLPPNSRAEGPVINADDNISRHPVGTYTDKFPMLQASPGDLVALRYQENGHVSLPATQANKPLNRGTVFIYGTTQPTNDDKLLSIHRVWNAEGTGGDGRGRLIATRNYDDGQCHQENDGEIATARKAEFPKAADPLQGTGLWCQVDLRIPEDIASGSTLTLYWVWDWPTLKPEFVDASVNGVYETQGESVSTPELYTSVVDISVVGSSEPASLNAAAVGENQGAQGSGGFIADQDVTNRAIGDQLNNMFLVDVDFSNSPNPGAAPSADTSTRATNTAAVPETKCPAQRTVTVTADPVTVTVTPEPEPVTVTVTVTAEPSVEEPATVTVTVDIEPTTIFTTLTTTRGAAQATLLPGTALPRVPRLHRDNWGFGY